MKTIEEIRHARLMQLLQSPAYPTVQSLATALKRSSAQVSQWKNRSKRAGGGLCNIESESARHIEKMTGKPRGWMDNDPQLEAGLPAAPAAGPPLSAWAEQIARKFDALPDEKRPTAFYVMFHMLTYNYWPNPADLPPAPPFEQLPFEQQQPAGAEPPAAAQQADHAPAPAPSAAPAASRRR